MPISRQKKEEIVAELKDLFGRSTIAVFTDFRGMSVSQMNDLRARLRESGAVYKVAKKTLLHRALQGKKIEGIVLGEMEGEIAVAFGFGEAIVKSDLTTAKSDLATVVPKILYQSSKEIEKPVILAGVFEGAVIGAEDIVKIATLPSREELFGRLAGSINAPIINFVGTLRGSINNLLNILNQIQKQKS